MSDANSGPLNLLQLAVPVSSKVTIDKIRLVRSIIESHADELRPTPVRFAFDSHTEHSAERQEIAVSVQFEVSSETEPGKERLLHVEATLCVTYKMESLAGLQQDNLDAFGKMNGVYNLWPYWREYVQSTTTRLGLPPLTLPALTGESLLALYQSQSLAEEPVATACSPESPGDASTNSSTTDSVE
jgi:preprotein translocase subunit SecB